MEKGFLWKKSMIILLVLAVLMNFLPAQPIDPWNLISLKKISTLIFTLSFLQVIGSFLLYFMGHRKGSLITGFLGGLVSSTATTAALADQSKLKENTPADTETLIFLSATLAMLFEGILITLLGSEEHKLSFLILFAGPVICVLFAVYKTSQKITESESKIEPSELKIIPLIKLTLFIFAVLSLSKILQNMIGGNALILLTFIVSLFEIHGSLIANIQLHDSGIFTNAFLGSLISVSIAATFISKLFLVRTLGSLNLKKQVSQITIFLFISLFVSWLLFWMYN
jgi:uncharacterized membrane protein (DUF4010 family)